MFGINLQNNSWFSWITQNLSLTNSTTGTLSEKKDQSDPPNHLVLMQYAEIPRRLLEDKYLEKKPSTPVEQIWKGITTEHGKAKQNEFLNQLIEGGMGFCSKALVVYLCNLYEIHKALEDVQESIDQKYGKDFFSFKKLSRTKEILNDISRWSLFNTLASKFSSKVISNEEFMKNIKICAEVTQNTVDHLQELRKTNPLLCWAWFYGMDGTLFSGGQFVKNGLKNGYICRLENIEDEETVVELEEIQECIKKDADLKEVFAEKSVSLFNFPFDDVKKFKKKWHQSLNESIDKLDFNEQEKIVFVDNLIIEAKLCLDTIPNVIELMLPKVNIY